MVESKKHFSWERPVSCLRRNQSVGMKVDQDDDPTSMNPMALGDSQYLGCDRNGRLSPDLANSLQFECCVFPSNLFV